MNMKKMIILFLGLVVIILCNGCDNSQNIDLDKTIIKNQMNIWAKGWEEKEEDCFYDIMVNEGIYVSIGNDFEEEDMTFEEYIEFMIYTDYWYCYSSTMLINSVKIMDEKDKAVLYGVWDIRMPHLKMQFPAEIHFIKSNDTWLITKIELGDFNEYIEGVEKEEFNPARHKFYLSFKVDGDLHVFHDHYEGVTSLITSIDPEYNEFRISVQNYATGERFNLEFEWEGERKGELSDCYPVSWDPSDDYDEYDENPDFEVIMLNYDLDNGLVEGNFSGEIANGDGNVVNITEGFFYIEHEFNIPELVIKEPVDNVTVQGKVTISGQAIDDSGIMFVRISIMDEDYDYDYDIFHIENNNWIFSFDSTKYNNGEYIVEVCVIDTYFNNSYRESIKIFIDN